MPVNELNSCSRLTGGAKQYVYGPAGPAYAVDSANAVTVYHSDGLGSVRSDGRGEHSDLYATGQASKGPIYL